LYLLRFAGRVAAVRDLLGVDPPVGVNAVAVDSTMLDTLAAAVSALQTKLRFNCNLTYNIRIVLAHLRPLSRHPLVRTGHLIAIAHAFWPSQPSSFCSARPLSPRRGRLGRVVARLVACGPTTVGDVHALHEARRVAFAARF
jgi:hypothetical protein